MENIKNIGIPTPCHQSWQQMTPQGGGRHCSNCSKIVTDFTAMTNGEIINYLSLANDVCGRFSQSQLNTVNVGLYADNETSDIAGWKRLALVMGIASFALSFKAVAQTKTATTEQVTKATGDSFMLGKVLTTNVATTRTITGQIYDDQNAPMPGVTVKILSGITGTITDTAGKFRLAIPADTKQLQVLFIGYKPLLVDICADENYQLKLTTEQYALMGEVVVTRTPLIKRIYYRCIKRPIRKIFN